MRRLRFVVTYMLAVTVLSGCVAIQLNTSEANLDLVQECHTRDYTNPEPRNIHPSSELVSVEIRGIDLYILEHEYQANVSSDTLLTYYHSVEETECWDTVDVWHCESTPTNYIVQSVSIPKDKEQPVYSVTTSIARCTPDMQSTVEAVIRNGEIPPDDIPEEYLIYLE